MYYFVTDVILKGSGSIDTAYRSDGRLSPGGTRTSSYVIPVVSEKVPNDIQPGVS